MAGIFTDVPADVPDTASLKKSFLTQQFQKIALGTAIPCGHLGGIMLSDAQGQMTGPLVVIGFQCLQPFIRVGARRKMFYENGIAEIIPKTRNRNGRSKIEIIAMEAGKRPRIETYGTPHITTNRQAHAVKRNNGRKFFPVGILCMEMPSGTHMLYIIRPHVVHPLQPRCQTVQLEHTAGKAYDAAIGLGQFPGKRFSPAIRQKTDILMDKTEKISLGTQGTAVVNFAQAGTGSPIIPRNKLKRFSYRRRDIPSQRFGRSRVNRTADQGKSRMFRFTHIAIVRPVLSRRLFRGERSSAPAQTAPTYSATASAIRSPSSAAEMIPPA